ncbi:Golgi integral membrane protein 4a isoform X1 [Syngnathus acus]|uniref:Golgi integral membrane protein 4a isoform X1 n=1 Tax=Syngnathus acus TaxID=161584 RepID=UPI001885F0D9|nr:Golgi integral membrane protein 4a isoform X1 [Syngnathus acus]
MGNGVCSRRQRRIFQVLLLVTVVCGMMYGGMVSYEMHKELKRTQAMALKYQQHQESLSAQLQVVYEHRSRLEKSLQKERLEHKKAKEDYLVYKLDSQQSLNKEKQESSSKLSSLHVQHQMLKNTHEDLKKQLYDMQEQHQMQGNDHNRLLEEHRERYEKMQQVKESEVAQLKDNVFNLREENKQLRKAHHEIHIQLQDAQVRHQDLKKAHDQVTLSLEDHKNALAAAQVQVNEYKELKESLNKAPNMRQPEQNSVLQQPDPKSQQAFVLKQPNEEVPVLKEDHHDTASRLDQQEPKVQSHPTTSEKDEEGDAERKRELAEEEMAQAGQPQKLEEEDPDQQREEQREDDESEQELEQPDENALDSQKHQLLKPQQGVERAKSAYEQQQEQQRLEVLKAEERRLIQMRQDSLQAQREKVLREREAKLKEEQEREKQQHQEADRREQLLREEQQRKKAEYEDMDHDLDQREMHHTDSKEEKHSVLLHGGMKMPHQQGAIGGGELDPEDDPNNQGEDEFEEAEEDQSHHRVKKDDVLEEEEEEEEPAKAKHEDSHEGPENPAMEDELVIAGNPDQQEDNPDDQYQEDAEEEAQEDIAGEKESEDKLEEDEEETYIEENTEQGPHKREPHGKDPEEENYEEEGPGRDKGTVRRAEM